MRLFVRLCAERASRGALPHVESENEEEDFGAVDAEEVLAHTDKLTNSCSILHRRFFCFVLSHCV